MELVNDEVLVGDNLVDAALDGTADGVALREVEFKVDALLRSRTLRVKEGNLLSILLAMDGVGDSPDFRRLAMCESTSALKTSCAS
jgi:hypothetical protein